MQTVEPGRTGEQVTRLALGAMQMGDATGEEDAVRTTDAGGSFVDTADCREWRAARGSRGGDSEEVAGRPARPVFLATEGSAEIGVTPNQPVPAWPMRRDAPPVLPLIGPRTPERLDDAPPARPSGSPPSS